MTLWCKLTTMGIGWGEAMPVEVSFFAFWLFISCSNVRMFGLNKKSFFR